MKGIAIPYIIAIILGIAVVVVIGAVFFNTSQGVTAQDCQNKLTTFCTVWRISGYSGSGPSGSFKQFSTACFNLGVGTDIDRDGCIKLLGGTVTTPTPATTPATATRPVTTSPGRQLAQLNDPCTATNDCDTGLICSAAKKCAPA